MITYSRTNHCESDAYNNKQRILQPSAVSGDAIDQNTPKKFFFSIKEKQRVVEKTTRVFFTKYLTSGSTKSLKSVINANDENEIDKDFSKELEFF